MDWTLPALKIILASILFLVLTGVCILLVTRIQHSLVVENKREHIVKLSNQGNFESIFSLSITSAEPLFNFQFLLNNIPLISAPQVDALQPVAIAPELVQQTPPLENRAQQREKRDGQNAIAQGGKAVAAKSGQAASFLGSLAALLPGNLGSGLRAQSETLRQTQVKAQSVSEAPDDFERKMQSLQQQSGRLVTASPAAAVGKPQPRTSITAQSSATNISPWGTVSNSSGAVKNVGQMHYTVHTQPVEPGSSLTLTLRIEASKKNRLHGTYAYQLSSQQIPVGALNNEEQPLVTKQGILHFPYVDFWRYWLAPVASFLVILFGLLILVLAFKFIWQ